MSRNTPENHRKHARAHYHRHKERLIKERTATRRQRKIDLVEYKGGKCEHCLAEYHPAVFEFHHRDPTAKEFEIARYLHYPLETVLPEVDKCLLLCANCHRIVHYRLEEANVS